MGTGLHSPDVRVVVDRYRTCELATVGRSGVPIAWPTSPLYQPDGTFLITTSIGLPQKAFNVRRNPKVGLLFSDPTASGLDGMPQVLVQGVASCPDEIVTSPEGLEEYWRRLMERQPANRSYASTPMGRWLMDWYYRRLLITIEVTHVETRPGDPATEPIGTPEGTSGDDDFSRATALLGGYRSAVLVSLDDSGTPTLRRVHPRADATHGHFVLDLPADQDQVPGPASLLCHQHDERLWNLRSFVAVGELARADAGWVLVFRRLVHSGDSALNAVGMLRGCRRAARGYLERRHLAPPPIPWDEYAAIKQQVVRRERASA